MAAALEGAAEYLETHTLEDGTVLTFTGEE